MMAAKNDLILNICGDCSDTINTSHRLTVVSYNLHGLNQGRVALIDLMSSIIPDIFMVQEHWLSPDNLYKLDAISDDYFVFGSSAMMTCVSSGPLVGRPFGGTAIFINKKYVSVTTNLITADRYTAIVIENWLLISVYMPCSGTSDRDIIINETICEIESVISDHSDCHCVIGGDFNTNLDNTASISTTINNFLKSNSLSRCDVLMPICDGFTYFNDVTHASSTIDYLLTSNIDSLIAFNVLDLDVNLSDHRPILAVCSCQIALSSNRDNIQRDHTTRKSEVSYFRWDHAPLESYYEHSRVLLQPVLDKLTDLVDKSVFMNSNSIISEADSIYNDVCNALRSSANMYIPKQGKNFFKFWWSQELDTLKDRAIASCKVWKDVGRPRSGSVFLQYQSDKLLYKKSIREHQAAETTSYTNELHEALLCKSGQVFWKVFKSKFGNNSARPPQVDGISDSASIAASFANHFENVCKPLSNKRNAELRDLYDTERAQYNGLPITELHLFDIELISKLLNNLKKGSAPGLDEISSEHLKFSHPIVVSILTKLFNLFLSFGHIPSSFGMSYTVPIPKINCHTRAFTVNDFRGISISPVISKLFEMAVIDRFSDYFDTSDNQFGFKKHLGCREAIYTVRNVIETYISNGSTVNVCTLDLSKAFDRMNHFALYLQLMRRQIPVNLLCIFELWFSMSVSCVKWNSHLSRYFSLTAGVRQGGVLSPILFSIYIDEIVDKVKSVNTGCYISLLCCSIFLYADDILLLSPSITGLQLLIDTCEKELDNIDMLINVKKSVSTRFGSRFNKPCAELVSNHGGSIKWSPYCCYLGIQFISGSKFRCKHDDAKSRFFRAFNAIYSKVGRFSSEDVILSLIRSKCIPILLYCMEVCPLTSRQKHSLEFSVTRIFMKLFRTCSSLVVRECQANFGFLPIESQLVVRTANFLQKFVASENSLCSLFNKVAKHQLNLLFNQYGNHLKSAHQLSLVINDLFFLQC